MTKSAKHLRSESSGGGPDESMEEARTVTAGSPFPDSNPPPDRSYTGESSDSLEYHKPPDPLVGTTIDGRYEIVKHIGEGGMGVVYKAKHVVLGKDLAIKVLRADVSKDKEIIARFRQEAQSASGIGSQHIIDISDFGQLKDGSTYFVMELLDGKELTEVIENEQPIPAERVAYVGKQLCDALGKAHEGGIVHRDMKPDNVFLVPRGADPDFVKVLDFGIAKVGGANSKLTKAGQVFGTPHYMSPEQCAGQMVDHRTDIYAIGVILYEMACGKVPFDADNLMGILTKHIYEQPIPPHQLPPPVSVPPGLEAVILKCLAKSTEQRYQSMAEVKADLLEFEAGRTPNAVADAVHRNAHSAPGLPGMHQPPGLKVEVGGHVDQGGGNLPLVLGALVGLLGLVITGLLVYFMAIREATPIEPVPPIVDVVEARDPVEDPIVEPPREPVAEEVAAQRVTIEIQSVPDRVEVLREDQNGEMVFVGNTPYPLEQPEEGASVRLVLRQGGFEDHEIRVGRLSQSPLRVTMTEAGSSRRSGSRRSGSHRSGSHRSNPDPPVATMEEAPPAMDLVRPSVGGTEVLDPWANRARRE